MNVIEAGLSRRQIIQAYIEYDASKKGDTSIDFEDWNWGDPDSMDDRLKAGGFKHGVITGFKEWNLVELSYNDLRECAIVNDIFKGLPQNLGGLTDFPEFESWKPHKSTEWYESLESGSRFPIEWALFMRPSVSAERPAKW